MYAAFLIVAISATLLWHTDSANGFTAVTDMEYLFDTEKTVIANMEAFISAQEQRLAFLRSHVLKFKNEHERAAADVSIYISNPLNAFQLIKRLTSDWRSIVESMRSDFYVEISANTTDILFPSDADLNDAAAALVRLQETYLLDTASVANGFLNGVQYSSPMSVEDCYELGKLLHSNGDFYHSKMWMQEAMRRLKKTSPSGANILEYIGKLEHNIESVQPPYKDAEQLEYERLCRSGSNRSPVVMALLHCRYVTNVSAFLRIGPLKLEEASLEPYIAIYHDVLYDAEIELIESLAKPKFARATVHGDVPFEATDARISRTAWLKDHEHDRLATLLRRVEDISGLTAATAEELQVVNYGIGGHYATHLDFFDDEKTFEHPGTGNRIATVLFYMNDVAMGGATVFPLANVAVQARKGTAAVWMNLYKSGVGDERTLHAACPVLLGSKWVCNKWLGEAEQDKLRPCELNPDHPS